MDNDEVAIVESGRETAEFGDDSNEEISKAKIDKIRESSSKVVVFSTDWTTETIVNQIVRGNINLSPDFQRRDAWQRSRKSKFIESLFLGIPVPQIVLAESRMEKGKYIVIDGKQRLLAIMQFAGVDADKYKRLSLSGLEILKSLNGKSKQKIGEGVFQGEQYIDISAFDNQSIRTVVIRNWNDESLLYEIFLRLNQGSVTLSPQELRQALLPGRFTNFIDDYAPQMTVIKSVLKLNEKNKADRRMRDSELLLRFISFRNFIKEYDGDLKEFYDKTCIYYNLNWQSLEGEIRSQIEEMETAYKVIERIFTEKNVFRKWTKDKYEARINRPLFDLILYYFSQPAIRRALVNKEDEFEDAFKVLCEDPAFRPSIESGTNNISPTQIRYKMFAEMLSDVLNTNVDYPIIGADDAGIIQ